MNNKKDEFVSSNLPHRMLLDQLQFCSHPGNNVRTNITLTDEDKQKESIMKTLIKTNYRNFSKISKITSLNLSNCKLSSINDALKDLPLKHLNLSKNELSEIPKCLYLGWNILEYLDISHNQIANFASEPNCCQKLIVLVLSNNLFEDIPEWILSLHATNLQELQYDFNRIACSRCLFDISLSFPVHKLSMRNCLLKKEDIRFMKECINLKHLDVSNSTETFKFANMINDIDQLFIKPTWKNIKILRMNNLSISIFPEGITQLETLSELYMRNNHFTWLPTNGLEFLVNLEILDLSCNNIVSVPENLTLLKYLKVLKLNHNKLEELPDISKMKSLGVLDLYDNNLTDFESFSPNLNFVDLEYNYFNCDECDLVNYKEMRDSFRGTLDMDQRYNGRKQMSDNFSEGEEGSSDSSFHGEQIAEHMISNGSVSWEDWDEEIRLSNMHEDVTLSDDEWMGDGLDSIPRLANPCDCVIHPIDSDIVYNENVIFCDAD